MSPLIAPLPHVQQSPVKLALPRRSCTWLRHLRSQREFAVFGMLVLVVLVLSFFSEFFLTSRNIANVGRQISVVGIVALGQALVIISGGIDLSVGSTIGISAVIAGTVTARTGSPLLGIVAAVTGTVNLRGKPHLPSSPRQAIRSGFALLLEGRKANGILPFRPVSENISVSALPRLARYGLLDRSREATMVSGAAREFGIVVHHVTQAIKTLSGGNQQKCILSRCLALSPEILLLDEPTHGVDVRTKEQFYIIIRALADQGMAILVVSSEMLELFQVASRILVLSGGRVGGLRHVADTTPVELMRDAFQHLT